jgi:hypothetical protein
MKSSSKFKFPQTPAPTRAPSPIPEIIKIGPEIYQSPVLEEKKERSIVKTILIAGLSICATLLISKKINKEREREQYKHCI